MFNRLQLLNLLTFIREKLFQKTILYCNKANHYKNSIYFILKQLDIFLYINIYMYIIHMCAYLRIMHLNIIIKL